MRPVLLILLAGFLWSSSALAAEKTYIYAASSMTGAVTALIGQLKSQSNGDFIGVFGASSTLARQIVQGAPADLYITAHPDWLDHVAQNDRLEPESQLVIAKNALVIAAPASEARPLDLLDKSAFVARLATGRLAISDPNHVPAGMYGKQALQALGLWPDVKDRLAIASNVRIALSYIERAETPLGIVYGSDLAGQKSAVGVALIPEAAHAPILYTLAVIRGQSTENTQAFIRFLQSAQGRAILQQFGFQAIAAVPK